jgi:hypothetical protein
LSAASTALPPCDQPSTATRSGATIGTRLQERKRRQRVEPSIDLRDRALFISIVQISSRPRERKLSENRTT